MKTHNLIPYCLFSLAYSLALVSVGQSVYGQEAQETQATAKQSQPSEQPSDAARISELQETLDEDRKQLIELEAELENPESEYAMAEGAFRELKDELERESEALEAARTAKDLVKSKSLELEIASIERRLKLAEERFDLAIEDRKTVREQIQTLHTKIGRDQAALDELTGESSSTQKNRDGDAMSTASSNEVQTNHKGHERAKESDRDEEEGGHVKPHSTSEKEENAHSEDMSEAEEEDEEIVEAAKDVDAKESEANAAQEETQSLADRIGDLQKLIAQEQKELTLARRKVELADAAQQGFAAEIGKRQSESADQAELVELRADASDASRRLILARSEVNDVVERLNDHRTELGMLQSEHIIALHEAEQKRQEANAAEDRLESLRNPFAPRNILQWLLDHGVRLLAIVVGMFFLNRIASFFSHRSIRLVSSGTSRGSTMERENRARTLVGVFQNAATVAIFITGFLMILEEVGANVTVLMGGVAVIGLAVAFGAQNLIKDYFYGFVMLLENQYMLNDSIRIGSLSGQVERITLRMTVLRDSNGVVHFVPNGTIDCVSNETHGWSRAVCEVSISYEEDLEQVMGLMRDVGRELKDDPTFGALMMGSPIEIAIDKLGESSIQLKVSVKTLPNKHGAVKQEWLRRIQNRFAQAGIRPPYPHRTVQFENVESSQVVGRLKIGDRPAA